MSEESTNYVAGEKLAAAAAVVPHVAIERPAEPVSLGHLGRVALPPDWSVVDVSASLPKPLRPVGCYKAGSVADLVALTKRFGSPERSLALLAADLPSFIAGKALKLYVYFDAGRGNDVGWRDFGAVLELEPSRALKRVLGFVSTGGDHRALVRLLDALVPHLVEPDAAVVRDAIMKLSLTKQVRFNRAEDLASGDIAFNFETITGQQTEAGRVRLPEHVSFSLPVFIGLSEQWEVEFKLRYQLKDEGVTFRLECEELEERAADVLEAVQGELRESFHGTAQLLVGSI